MKDLIKTILYQPLYNLLIFLAWLMPGNSIGLAIIFLTIIIRLILLPSSLKAARSQVRLQALQPKINEIRKNYKDQQEQSRALMELYKTEGVSPFSSCLPQLIQLPILFILYKVFQVGLDSSRFSLLYSFTPHPEVINPHFLGLNLANPDLWILPLLAGASQFVLSMLMMPKSIGANSDKDPTQMMMKQMNYIFPIMNIIFARIVPAAVALYWIVTTLFSIVQQLYVNKSIRNNSTEQTNQVVAAAAKSNSNEKPGRKDLLSRLSDRRLNKAEKKSGVSVSIRKKR